MSVYRRDYMRELKKPSHGDSVWMYAFSYRKIRYRQAGFRTKREAELAEDGMRKEVILDGRIVRPLSAKEFVACADEALTHRSFTCAAVTVACERARLRTIQRFFAGRQMHRLSVSDVNAFIRRRKADGMSNRTVNIDLNLLRVIFKHSVQNGYASHDPMREVKNLSEPLKDRPIPTLAEIQRIVDEASKLPSSEPLVTWIRVRMYSGVRPNEAVHIEWRDVDFEKNLIYIRPKDGSPLKTGEFRVVPLHPDLKAVLLNWRRSWEEVQKEHGGTHDWVFFHPHQPRCRALGFRESFRKACRNAGIHMRSYDFRHLFLSLAVMSGCDLMAVTKWAGHGSVRMIEKVYGHLSPEYHADQMARIDFRATGQRPA